MTRLHGIQRNDGVALFTVLALLVLFLMFGLAWVDYMGYERDQSNFQIQGLRTNYAAQGGIAAGIQAARDAVAAGNNVFPPEPLTLEVPVYRGGGAEGAALELSVERVCKVRVRLEDESARVNINHAPPNVLREILGVDGERAREIRSSLPRTEGNAGEDDGNRRWFTSVDELAARELVGQEILTPELKKMLTVYTVPAPEAATGYMNVNTAPERVITALLDVTPGVAAQVAEARPFSDVNELSAAAGKDPATFNVRPAPDALNALPAELSFRSRCFRIVSAAELLDVGESGDSQRVLATARIEAVVYIDEQGNSRVMYWNESAQRDEEAEQESAPESPAA